VTHKTKALVLRAVKYGDTSLVVTALTQLFGLQTYMVKGVRSSGKSKPAKAVLFQPGALLDMVVYHNKEGRHMEFVKEYDWACIYQNLFTQVIKNAVAQYMIELLLKTIKQPEDNPGLYDFAEAALLALDKAGETTTANFPLYFCLHLTSELGFQLLDEEPGADRILDLRDGKFINGIPDHPYYLAHPGAAIIGRLLQIQDPSALDQVLLNRHDRRQVLEAMETFYNLHISEFGKMKTLPVLQEVLG
jgi:DNA repair protein RecO (recombination protein O)